MAAVMSDDHHLPIVNPQAISRIVKGRQTESYPQQTQQSSFIKAKRQFSADMAATQMQVNRGVAKEREQHVSAGFSNIQAQQQSVDLQS